MLASSKYIAAGSRVKIKEAVAVPTWSTWDDDGQRTSTPVKKRLQKQFFSADKKIAAEIVYITNESERDKLRNQGRVKVQLRDAAGSLIIITAPVDVLKQA